MEQTQLLARRGSSKITREELKLIPSPEASATHQPIAHNQELLHRHGLSFRPAAGVRALPRPKLRSLPNIG
jgi:hypothetical protein